MFILLARCLRVWVQALQHAHSPASKRRVERVDAAPTKRRPAPVGCGARPNVLRLNDICMFIMELYKKFMAPNTVKLFLHFPIFFITVKVYLKSSLRVTVITINIS